MKFLKLNLAFTNSIFLVNTKHIIKIYEYSEHLRPNAVYNPEYKGYTVIKMTPQEGNKEHFNIIKETIEEVESMLDIVELQPAEPINRFAAIAQEE